MQFTYFNYCLTGKYFTIEQTVEWKYYFSQIFRLRTAKFSWAAQTDYRFKLDNNNILINWPLTMFIVNENFIFSFLNQLAKNKNLLKGLQIKMIWNDYFQETVHNSFLSDHSWCVGSGNTRVSVSYPISQVQFHHLDPCQYYLGDRGTLQWGSASGRTQSTWTKTVIKTQLCGV